MKEYQPLIVKPPYIQEVDLSVRGIDRYIKFYNHPPFIRPLSFITKIDVNQGKFDEPQFHKMVLNYEKVSGFMIILWRKLKNMFSSF